MSSSVTADATATDLIAEFFNRFGSGDQDGALALFAPDVDFLVAGADFVPWTGARRTSADIRQFLESATSEVTTREFDVEKIVADDTDAVALGRFTHVVNRTGKAFTSRFALRVGVGDGLINRYHMFEDSYAVAEAFSA